MNSIAPATTTVKPLPTSLVTWLEARGYIVDTQTGQAKRTMPLTFEVSRSIPYIWGAQDAAVGLTCVPEMQWVQRRDQRDYAAGYASVAGHNETTRYFLGN